MIEIFLQAPIEQQEQAFFLVVYATIEFIKN